MFDPETEKATEQRRSHMIMALGAIGALILAGGVVFFTRSAQPPPLPPVAEAKLEDALRAGAPEFDNYKAKVALEDEETYAAQNTIGMVQFTVRAKLHNRGDRSLTGIEIVGRVYDLEDKVIARSVSIPIPRIRSAALGPGESMPIVVKVDPPARIREADVKQVKIELQGLRFQ